MNSRTCFMVGEGLLCLEALRELIAREFSVRGVLSHDAAIADLCGAMGVRVHTRRDEFVAALHDEELDYLFSVNNAWILPASVLSAPREAAINFHDAPLPRYAGLFATSWALIHGEPQHGVSWHRMQPEIDAGDLLARRPVPVRPDDTAHTLNARCFEAALEALRELLDALREGTLRPQRQAAEGGTYFGLRDRPWASGLLDFRQDAETLERLVRALDFGSAHNPFAAAKCALGDELRLVRRARVRPGRAGAPPGTLLAAGATGLTVQTGDGALELERLEELSGAPVDMQALAQALALEVGRVLPRLSPEDEAHLDARFRDLARHEPFWVRRVAAARPLRGVLAPARRLPKPITHPLPTFTHALDDLELKAASATGVGLVAAFCSRLASEEGHLGYAARAASGAEAACFAALAPLSTAAKDGTVREHLEHAERELAELSRRGTYARDLVARTPALRQRGAPSFELAVVTCAAEHVTEVAADIVFALPDAEAGAALTSHTALEPSLVQALDRALAVFVRAALAQPEARVVDLPLLEEAAALELVVETNPPPTAYPRTARLTELFTRSARRHPDAIAVRHGARALRYSELDRASDQLARALCGRGVGSGDRVLVSLPHSVELVIAFLGIMKAGATYVPLDPDVPTARRAWVVGAAEPSLVLCEPGGEEGFGTGVCITVAALTGERGRPPALNGPASERELAYIIFTSGSTGTPKGVEVLQRGLVNHAVAIQRLYGLNASDRVLCSASVGFDVCGEQIYPALLAGAEVVMRPADLFDSLARFEDFVRREAITTLMLPTGLWHEWVRTLDEASSAAPPSLRLVAVGTEKVQAAQLAAFDRLTGAGVRFFQGYGPTEATITCTVYEHVPGALDAGMDVPIGRPLANTRAYVLDAQRRPLPPGLVGELYVAGDGLARGYLGNPQLTAERFVDDPFFPGQRMYRTGDRARLNGRGELVFLGRTDNQVKVRGYRVEPSEIEAALTTCRGVRECVVMLPTDGPARGRLSAYVVGEPPLANVDAEGLRAELSKRLPSYMVPSCWMVLDRLPRTLNQKVDHAALPAPVRRAHAAIGDSPPMDARQGALCALISELLGGQHVGVRDDFFRDLGGDSLLAVRLLSRVAQRFGVEVALSDFTREPTVAWLSHRLDPAGRAEPSSRNHVLIQDGHDKTRVPLWLLPPVGGHVNYGELLRPHLHPSQPVYGIEAQGLRRGERPLERIEDMAARCLRIIREVQPQGPYVIAGPSLGGLVAWDLARRLQAQQESPTTVVLLDTWAPGYPRVLPLRDKLRDQARTLVRQRSFSALWRLVYDRSTLRLRSLLHAVPHYGAADDLEGAVGERIRRVVYGAQRANLAYRPEPCRSDVLLFRATRRPHWSGVRFESEDNGWGAFVAPGRLQIVPVDTTHSELSDRPPSSVATVLQTVLDAARLPDPSARGSHASRRAASLLGRASAARVSA